MPETNPPENLPTGEPKEFFQREEIKTMERDVAELREEEAKEEKERIASLNPEIKIQAPPAPPLPPVPMPPLPPAPPVIPPIPPLPSQRPSPPSGDEGEDEATPHRPPFSFKKIIIRGLIIIISLAVLGLGFWLWLGKKPAEQKQPAKTEAPVSTTTEEVVSEEETIQAPTIQEKPITWGFHLPAAARTIDTIIIHSNYNALEGDLYDIEKILEGHRNSNTANHFLIDRAGVIYRLLPDTAVAYQAGTGVMPDGRRKNVINSFSLGIQLIYAKTESPNEAQYQSLAWLVNLMKQQYDIPTENILANYQINAGRKDDPWNFDWEHFNSLLE